MEVGTVLGGRYRLEALAGAGGMGTVFRAEDTRAGSPCAVKVLVPDATPRVRERFIAEALVLASLSHPSIVRYLDHGRDPDFLVMEWVEGPSLAARLDHSGITPEEALRLSARLIRGLAAAHGKGVVHRDVKPSNIMLLAGSLEQAKIVDFGVARTVHGAGPTATGARVGTPRYMAPEQILSSRRVDGRADVFSVGCVTFEALAGRRAFRGDDEVAVLARMVIEEAPRVRALRDDLPDEVDAVVAELLARDRAFRPFADEVLAERLVALAARTRGLSVPVRAGAGAGAGAGGADDDDFAATADNTLPELVSLPASSTRIAPIPKPATPTFGRELEIAAVARALVPGAAVGVWGVLGGGKSRLAYEVARRAPAPGAVICDLRSLARADDLVRRIAAALGASSVEDAEGLAGALAARRNPWIILDGCDGARAEAVALATRLVELAPACAVLVVARERPTLEVTFEVGALEPDAGAQLFASLLARSGSRSKAGARSGTHTESEGALRQIAARLHNNPLAITLASARASVLGLGKVLERLTRPLELLGSARVDAYPESLREALAVSWEALEPNERVVAACASLFWGPFAAASVEAIAGADATLDALQALRDKSWLAPAPSGFLIMPAVMRDFARLTLTEPEATAVRCAFAREVVSRAEQAAAAAEPPAEQGAPARVALIDDLAAAVGHAADIGEVDLVVRAALALDPLLSACGPLPRLEEVLTRGLGLVPLAPSAGRARLLAASGRVAALRGAFDRARPAFDAAMAMASALGDAELEATTWLDRGVMHHMQGDLVAAERCYHAVLAVHDAETFRATARAEGNLGALAHDQGDHDAAYRHYVRAIVLAEALGDARLLGVFLGNLAVLDREKGRANTSRHRFLRALRELESAHERRLVGITLGNLGMLELEHGRVPAALSAFEQSVRQLAALGDARSEALAHARLAAALAVDGRSAEAEDALGQADRLARGDPSTRAVVAYFRGFTEPTPESQVERGVDSVAALAHLVARSDDVRAAERILATWKRSRAPH